MRHRLAAPIALAISIPACAAAPPPPPPAIVVAPPLPAPPPPPPPGMLVIPRGEASPRLAKTPPPPAMERLHSEGRRHALARSEGGVVIFSEDRGALGLIKAPAPIVWAGFVEDDAVLVVTAREILRAQTPDAAVAGAFDALGAAPPGAALFASGGSIVLAASPAPDGPLYVSRDAGRHFAAEKRPAPGVIHALAVRADGLAAVAVEKERRKTMPVTILADVYTGKDARAFHKGPTGEAQYSPLFVQSGDFLGLYDAKAPSDHRLMGLDKAGRWIVAAHPGGWLPGGWTDTHISISPPEPRPGYAKAPKNDLGGLGLLGGVGGLGSGTRCRGVACLARRPLAFGTPRAGAFHDGACAKQDVITRSETYDFDITPGKHGKPYTSTWNVCAPDKPALHAATLLVRDPEAPRLARLPTSCAEGVIIGTDRASFIRCSTEHRGDGALLAVLPHGPIAAVGTPGPKLTFRGAESASDGTTILFTDDAGWLCATDGTPCAPLPAEGFLTARPVPGKRALIARRGQGEHDLDLVLHGEPGARAVHVAPPGNVLRVEVTAAGNVRVWTHPTSTRLAADIAPSSAGAAGTSRFLVREDGLLLADTTAD